MSKVVITIEIDGEEVKVSTEEKKSEKEVIKEKNKIDIYDDVSEYARFFDDMCHGWSKNPEYNLMYLRQMQTYANDMLRAKGHLLLNDVYDMLGILRSKAGCVVGWIYDEKNPIGDNYVDFGLYHERNKDFINGRNEVIILDFNVDGCIVDRI